MRLTKNTHLWLLGVTVGLAILLVGWLTTSDVNADIKSVKVPSSGSSQTISDDDPQTFLFTTSKTAGIKHTLVIKNKGKQNIHCEITTGDAEEMHWYTVKAGTTRTLWDKKWFPYGTSVTLEVLSDPKKGKKSKVVPFTYSIKENVTPPSKNTVKKIKVEKKKVKISYTSVRYAKRYQIAVRNRDGSWSKYTSSSTSKTLTRNKSKKAYTVKVRGQRYYKGKWYSGSWSKIKRVEIKKK